MLFVRAYWGLLLALLLSACAQTSFPLADSLSGLWRAGILGGSADSIPAKPDLRYGYMRAQVKGNTQALLVYGFLDQTPSGPVEVWYSGSREALRMQNGRIVGVSGATYDWAGVRMQPLPPAWTAVPAQGFGYTRTRDQMPGYAYGIADQMRLTPVQGVPDIDLLPSLPKDKAQSYQWFREQSEAQSGQAALPDGWFAWGKHRGEWTVVYSEQCLAPDFCLRLQRWPVLEEEP